MMPPTSHVRSATAVSADVDRLLSPKSLTDLMILEKQVTSKLQSDEPIDVEYWELLLRNVSVYKSRAELNTVYKTIIESRLADLRQEQRAEASKIKDRLALLLTDHNEEPSSQPRALRYSRQLDPEPFLKIPLEDRSLDVIDEEDFLDKNVRAGWSKLAEGPADCGNRLKRGKES